MQSGFPICHPRSPERKIGGDFSVERTLVIYPNTYRFRISRWWSRGGIKSKPHQTRRRLMYPSGVQGGFGCQSNTGTVNYLPSQLFCEECYQNRQYSTFVRENRRYCRAKGKLKHGRYCGGPWVCFLGRFRAHDQERGEKGKKQSTVDKKGQLSHLATVAWFYFLNIFFSFWIKVQATALAEGPRWVISRASCLRMRANNNNKVYRVLKIPYKMLLHPQGQHVVFSTYDACRMKKKRDLYNGRGSYVVTSCESLGKCKKLRPMVDYTWGVKFQEADTLLRGRGDRQRTRARLWFLSSSYMTLNVRKESSMNYAANKRSHPKYL